MALHFPRSAPVILRSGGRIWIREQCAVPYSSCFSKSWLAIALVLHYATRAGCYKCRFTCTNHVANRGRRQGDCTSFDLVVRPVPCPAFTSTHRLCPPLLLALRSCGGHGPYDGQPAKATLVLTSQPSTVQAPRTALRCVQLAKNQSLAQPRGHLLNSCAVLPSPSLSADPPSTPGARQQPSCPHQRPRTRP